MKRYLIFFFFLLFVAFSSEAGPVLPARIGGSVTVDGVKLTQATSAGYVLRVTGKDGKGFSPPAENKSGLNKKGIYLIDIPIYDPNSQPEGAKPKSTAVIHVLKNGVELKVVKPSLGKILVGKGGTITSVDLVVLSANSGPVKEKK